LTRCRMIIVLWILILILLLSGMARAEDTEICPEDDNGSDIIECPLSHGDSGVNKHLAPVEYKEIQPGEEYSEHDKKRLFRVIKKPEATKEEDVKDLLDYLKGK